jgi:hypothetical protein
MKETINKLILDKTSGAINDGHKTYYFNWYNDNQLILSEKMWIFFDSNGNPQEEYNIDDMITQRKICCFNFIEPITIEII